MQYRYFIKVGKKNLIILKCILFYGIENNYVRYCCRYGDRRELNSTKTCALELGGRIRYKIEMKNVHFTLKSETFGTTTSTKERPIFRNSEY